MDLDKLAAFISKVGIIPAMLGWLAYEFHGYIAQQVTYNQQMLYLMQRLIDLHTK